MTLDEVIKINDACLTHSGYCGNCEYENKCAGFEVETVRYLKTFRTLLQGMQEKGIKKVTLADKQTVISAEPKAEQAEEKVSHVVMDSGNYVCECGQGIERWHMYCYHCGKKLVWDKVDA